MAAAAAAAAAGTPSAPETKETASRCTMEEETVAHTFEIVGYSVKKGIGVGKSVRSGAFAVGGCEWMLRFCPDGMSARSEHAFIHLELLTKKIAEVRVRHEVSLVRRPSGALGTLWPPPAEPTAVLGGSRDRSVSFRMSRAELEASGFVHDDRLTIRCVVTVINEPTLSDTTPPAAGFGAIDVPPSDITAHLGWLLESGEGADVTFTVDGESFAAHKVVLAARSPVLRAELFGPMKSRSRCVAVEDMQPEVFRALLHFAYRDALPDDLSDLEAGEYAEMVRHLLVAADRYAMERLKLMCQSILARDLDAETVAITLGLADQYNCDKLKDACIEFMMPEDEMKAVMATKGYENLKRSCPTVLVEVLERKSKRVSV